MQDAGTEAMTGNRSAPRIGLSDRPLAWGAILLAKYLGGLKLLTKWCIIISQCFGSTGVSIDKKMTQLKIFQYLFFPHNF